MVSEQVPGNARPTIPSQADTLAWVRERWPDRCDPIWRAAKLCEEAGEVMGAVIKEGEVRKTKADIAQETAQLVICAMALAESVGFHLLTEVADEYERCQVRTWDAPVTWTECDCVDNDGLRAIKCENDATWTGDNHAGAEVFTCDDHRHLLAFGTMRPVSSTPTHSDDSGSDS